MFFFILFSLFLGALAAAYYVPEFRAKLFSYFVKREFDCKMMRDGVAKGLAYYTVSVSVEAERLEEQEVRNLEKKAGLSKWDALLLSMIVEGRIILGYKQYDADRSQYCLFFADEFINTDELLNAKNALSGASLSDKFKSL